MLIGTYLLDLIVDTLNVRHAKTVLPEEFKGYYDTDRYKKSQAYLRETTRFGIIFRHHGQSGWTDHLPELYYYW